MLSFLRLLMLLALIVWIGGIIFFAFVEAPTLFVVLPTTRMAGDVVSVSLAKLHWMGLFSGIVFLIGSLAYNKLKHAQIKPFAASHVFIALMLILTAYSQFGITRRMREIRTEMQTPGVIEGYNDPRRSEFYRLHEWSTRVEGSVLFLGIGVVLLTSRRFGGD